MRGPAISIVPIISIPETEHGNHGIPAGCHLSRICRSDKAAYLEHLVDPEIARNTLAIPYPYTEADADWWLAHCERKARDPEVNFAVREPQGQLIGAIGIVEELAPEAFRAEFGYWLAKPWRGRGLMTEVVRAFADYAFTQLGLRRLCAAPYVPNVASQRVLEKAGFRREGLLRGYCRKGGEYLDVFNYARLAGDSDDDDPR